MAQGLRRWYERLQLQHHHGILASPYGQRDLADLVEKGVLVRTGEHKYARYRLNLLHRT